MNRSEVMKQPGGRLLREGFLKDGTWELLGKWVTGKAGYQISLVQVRAQEGHVQRPRGWRELGVSEPAGRPVQLG